MTKKMTVKEDTSLAEFDYGEDAGAGDEDQSAADYVVPFLVVLQPMSPQCQEGIGKPGQFYNTVSGNVCDAFTFAPVKTERKFMEWVPRKQGGGLVGTHTPDSEVVRDAMENSVRFGQYATQAGNDLVETFYVHVLVTEGPDEESGAMLAFTSTKIQPYKKWNTKRAMFKLPNGQKPPIFAHHVEATTVKQKNDQGTFWNIVMEPAKDGNVAKSLLAPDDPRMSAAKNFREMLNSGQAKVDYEGEKAGATKDTDDDDGIPF